MARGADSGRRECYFTFLKFRVEPKLESHVLFHGRNDLPAHVVVPWPPNLFVLPPFLDAALVDHATYRLLGRFGEPEGGRGRGRVGGEDGGCRLRGG